MLNIVCVNNNDYLGRGEEYVDRLRKGIESNCTLPYTFFVIENCINEGWWAKLEIFKYFPVGDRILYFDLDTLVTGNIDDLAAYNGEFMALSDWYHPEVLNSSIMLFESGTANNIYDKWVELGKPKLMGGDQQWIYMMKPAAKRIQIEIPNKVVSYKAHCRNGVPDTASVVCFHGRPRPHEVDFLIQTGEKHVSK